MRKNQAIALFLLFLPIFALAQGKDQGMVKGKVIDSANGQSLAEATISILRMSDSSFVKFALSNNKGEFEIRGLKAGSFYLLISFQGCENYMRNFVLNAQSSVVEFGNISLYRRGDLLDSVIVERPPVSFKKDTIEFNASAFKTKPDATAEDLLKVLPGFQLDKQGNIRSQGEAVQKVYVDGKEFFGNDPKLATRNITANMIESVQVYDDFSDQAKFTRIDDGSRQKTINLKLKKEYKSGYFGRANLGSGSNERYDGSVSFNRFHADQRLSILASANNVNKVGFSFNDVMGAVGGFGNLAKGLSSSEGGRFSIDGFGGGNNFQLSSMQAASPSGFGTPGIISSLSSGLNFIDQFGGKLDFNGSYFFSRPRTESRAEYIRQNYFPNDSAANEERLSHRIISNQNHAVSLRFEFYIDSMNSIMNKTNISLQRSEDYLLDSTTNYAITKNERHKALAGSIANEMAGNGLNLNNTFLYRHKLRKRGRTFTLSWNSIINNIETNNYLYSSIQYFNADGSDNGLNLQQLKTQQDIKGFNNNIASSYTEPIGQNKLLEINYSYLKYSSLADREGYDFNGLTGKYDSLNTLQTIHFRNNFVANRFGANFRWFGKKTNFQVGASIQQSTQEIKTAASKNDNDSINRQHYLNILPTANFNYNISRSGRFNANYRGRTILPTINQLQPTTDLSDPLYIREGNPGLNPEFNNTLSLNYTSFSISNFHFITANVNISNSFNKIVNSIDSSGDPGVQRIRPINVNGAFNLVSFFVYGIPLKNKFQGSNVNFTFSTIYNKLLNELYKKRNQTETLVSTLGISSNLDLDEVNIFFSTGLSYNKAVYSLSKQFNTTYCSYTGSAEISYLFLKNYVLSINFDYFNINGNPNFKQSVFLLNGGVSRKLFKKKNGEIKFLVNDVLNQNKGVSRRIGENFLEDNNSLVLKRYFLLSFFYRFNASNNSMDTPDGLPKQLKRQMDRLRISN